MGETKPADSDESKPKGWFKTLIGTLAGLLSGVVVMYASPLLDKVIKPARPVANFAVDYDSLTVIFHNRSSGSREGWWDFGDGSPLEPLHPKDELITHTYPGPGEYTAKLLVRNLVGDENERTVAVRVDKPQTALPIIDSIEAVPLSAGGYAPATFRVSAKVRNTQLCIWDLGDDRPLEICTDHCETQDRMVTFNKPGGYVIKLAAVNGNQAKERSEIVYVSEPPAGTVTLILNVSEQATQVEMLSTSYTFEDTFPPNSTDSTHSIDRLAPARLGYEIVDVRLPALKGMNLAAQGYKALSLDAALGGNTRDLRLNLSPDRRSVRLTGELIKDPGSNKKAAAPNLVFPVTLVQERRVAATRPAIPMTATTPIPGTAFITIPPVPPDWIDVRRQLSLQLLDGNKIIWQESFLPRAVPVTVQNRRCLLTAVPAGDQVRVDLVEDKAGMSPTAN